MGAVDGRVALVTGAGRGVGLGVAQELAEAGAAVAVNDLHAERAEAAAEELRRAGGRAIAAPFDVTDLAAVRSSVARIERELGPVDILVNNAGIPEDRSATGPFKDSDPATWHLQIDLNLYGAAYCIRTVLPGMVERGWGRVIQISSGAASRGVLNTALYAAGKSAMEGLIRTVAVEVARSGVTLNSVALGLMARDAPPPADPGGSWQQVMTMTPMGRVGEPREIGACIVWLCSQRAGWVTAQTIHVDGAMVQGK